MSKKISFNLHSQREARLISKIVSRVASIDPKVNRMCVNMDITATHCNGTPLDLEGLLAFDEFNFRHDVFGICRHLNRRTGKLENGFRPRCAQKGQVTA